jgi:hypothetical protein
VVRRNNNVNIQNDADDGRLPVPVDWINVIEG